MLLQALLGGSTFTNAPQGVVSAIDYLVTANGTPNMTVNVAAGAAFINGTETSTQGAYGVMNDGSVSVPIAASSGSNARISWIALQVLDDFYSGSSHIGQLIEVAGTPASSPVAPALPKNSIGLAQVRVPASATSIISADITDERVFYPSNPALLALIATANGLITALQSATAAVAWTAITGFTNSWTAGSPVPAYRKIGTRVYLRGLLASGAAPNAAFTLPSTVWPQTAQNLVADSNGVFGVVQVSTAGVVTPHSGNAPFSLDGISWDVTP